MISNWWTDAAPWRWAVPRQSAPVSPPPMITTRLPSAVIGGLGEVALLHPVGQRQVLHGLVDAGELAAGDGQVAPAVAPPASTTASNVGPQLVGGDVDADVDADVRNSVPSARIWSSRRSRWRFSILNSGMP